MNIKKMFCLLLFQVLVLFLKCVVKFIQTSSVNRSIIMKQRYCFPGSAEWLYCKMRVCGVSSVIRDLDQCSQYMDCTETRLIRDTLVLIKSSLDFLDGHMGQLSCLTVLIYNVSSRILLFGPKRFSKPKRVTFGRSKLNNKVMKGFYDTNTVIVFFLSGSRTVPLLR